MQIPFPGSRSNRGNNSGLLLRKKIEDIDKFILFEYSNISYWLGQTLELQVSVTY
jgi:hypothetical protein